MNHVARIAACLIYSMALLGGDVAAADETKPVATAPKKVVLIAGKKSHGPEGNGTHDYGWSAKLLKVMLDNSNVRDSLRVEVHLDGWPRDPHTLDDADTIMVISDGRDGDKYEEALHLATPDNVQTIARQMARGCGLITFHFSTFAPDQYSEQMLDWTGGFFDWEDNGERKWYSAIRTLETDVEIATPAHPVSRGLKPLKMKEEFYYNLRFRPQDAATRPIWTVPALPGREPDGRVVAWARQRPDGGRGFGTTAGHFYDNWQHDTFRRMILNAIAWTAKVDIPTEGVDAPYFTRDEVTVALAPISGTQPATLDRQPIRVLLFAGNDAHKWHNWERTTQSIKQAIERDSRMRVEVSNDIEDLGRKKLTDYQVIVQNFCNWHDPKQLSDGSKSALVDYLKNGGGLVVVHFANGAFHFSLPKAGESDWPEYRKIVRRVWDHHGQGESKSGHDRFGAFNVKVVDSKHPITAGLADFGVTDELYFRQAGDEAISPMITARSQVTGRDEPLAWNYLYERGRVFQTLLGHSEKTYDSFEPREMLRRAVAWCANRPVRVLTREIDLGPTVKPTEVAKPAAVDEPLDVGKALVDGKLGKALDASRARLKLPAREEYRTAPLTLELWCKLNTTKGYHILVANEHKSSSNHWELFAMAGSGALTLYAPGCNPDHVRTSAAINDEQWHSIAMIYEAERVRLFVDGKQVEDQVIQRQGGQPQAGELSIGSLVDRSIGCRGLIDDVRLSRGVRMIDSVPDKPLEVDDLTVGLWRFDDAKGNNVVDLSRLGVVGELTSATGKSTAPQAAMPPEGVHLTPVDKRLKTVLIDRSANDAYMAVKADTTGRLFVGGREALFVFEPNDRGGYQPRRELCKFPQDSIIIGIEWRGLDLYVLTSNALYIVPEGRTRREGIEPRRLVWGLPLDLHVSFHCLAWGPEGDLYFNHGDPLLNYGDFNRADHWGHWTLYTKHPAGKKLSAADGEWCKVPYTGQGAVLRVKPDGSDLRVVATGLRGPVGLAFDPRWNLFTNDNDHESRADQYAPAKLLHVTAHADFGWPRGWIASKSPDRSDLLEPMNSTLGRGVPCDLLWYDEPRLPKEYRGQLMMCRWERNGVFAYPTSPRGASFASEERPLLAGVNQVRPVGMCVGRGGRIFVTSLYLGGNVWSPYCPSDLVMLTTSDDAAGYPFEAYEITKLSDDELWKKLSSSSWEERYRVHQEIVRRGGAAVGKSLAAVESIDKNDPALLHLPWLAALARHAKGWSFLQSVASGKGDEHLQVFKLQAIAALAETAPLEIANQVMESALADANPQAQLTALAYFFNKQTSWPFEKVVNLARSKDTYLRQIATRLLAARADYFSLKAMLVEPDASTRLAAVLAVGTRLTVPAVDEVPPADLPLIYTSGNAKFEQTFADEPKAANLRELARVGSYTIAERWNILPRSAEQNNLCAALFERMDHDKSTVQAQATYYLSLLKDKEYDWRLEESRFQSLVTRLQESGKPVAIKKCWMLGPIDEPTLNKLPSRPESGSIDLSAMVDTPHGQRKWQAIEASLVTDKLMTDVSAFTLPLGVAGRAEVYLYLRVTSSVRQQVVLSPYMRTGILTVWLNGQSLGDVPTRTSGADGVALDLQPGSNELLLRQSMSSMKQATWSAYLVSEKPIELSLPDKLDSAALAERLRDAARGGSVQPNAAEFAAVDWPAQVKQGDLGNGRRLFASLGCAKCHAVGADQKVVGAPSLSEARRRFQVPHLVESVLVPSKQVAEAFRATSIVTSDGQSLSGLIVGETASTIELLLPDTSRRTIAKKEIDERERTSLSPMPVGLVKTPAELRDVLAYLLSDNPTPP